MQTRVMIGCPYTSMNNLQMAFREIGEDGLNLVSADEVIGFDGQKLFLKNISTTIPVESFGASFLRYPYDLIPPPF